MNIANKAISKRLPINFHQTFVPERRYISALLRYAAAGKQGTDQNISEATGIPVGQSSGKVPAIINYATGMGLVRLSKGDAPKHKKPLLTDFGRMALLEDSNLSEPLSQWLAHLHLCRMNGGAEIWHQTFGPGRGILGASFSEPDLNEYLNGVFGKKNKSLVGPMIRAYEEQAALRDAGVLERNENLIALAPAPLLNGFIYGYAAFLLSIWDIHFPQDRQVTFSDFEGETYWQQICGWSDRQLEVALEMIQHEGAIEVDRQMRPWVLIRKSESAHYWQKLYSKLA